MPRLTQVDADKAQLSALEKRRAGYREAKRVFTWSDRQPTRYDKSMDRRNLMKKSKNFRKQKMVTEGTLPKNQNKRKQREYIAKAIKALQPITTLHLHPSIV
jgi:hypothetical protein